MAESRRLWRLAARAPGRALSQTVRSFRREGLDARSAHVAYYGMLLLPPVLILVIAAASRLPVAGILEALTGGTEAALPEGAAHVILAQVEAIRAHRTPELTGLALGVVAFAGGRLFMVLARGLNAAFGVREGRPSWRLWFGALALAFAAVLLLVVASAFLLAGPLLRRLLVAHGTGPALGLLLSDGVRFTVVVLAALFATATLHRVLPDVRRRWLPLTPGAALSVAAWFALTLGFKAWVERFGRYSETYGALAGVVLLMIWFYLTAVTFFFGAQLDAVLFRTAGEGTEATAAGGASPRSTRPR
jgi:membrane protein